MTDTDRRSVVDWLFRSRESGQIVIAQAPNPSLLVFLAATVAGWATDAGSTLDDAFAWIATAGLAWWAIDEIVRGLNPWRRILGVAGCGLVLARVLNQLA